MKKHIFPAVFCTCISCIIISCVITLTIAFYNPVDYAILWSVLVTIALVLIFALISFLITINLSNRFKRKATAVNVENPKFSNTYKEFEPLKEKLIKHNEEYEKQINNLNTDHDSQDDMRRQFTANVSHELKTPLTSVSGYAELIRDGMVLEDKIPEFAGKIYDETQRMINLVGDIIKLSQFDEKHINVKIERVNLMELSKAVVADMATLAQKRKVSVTVKGDNAEINAAELIVEEMIHNLVQNAIKYNKPEGKVEVKIKQCADGVELSVKDTGIGIPQEDIAHIFERFYRVDKSHSKEIGGTGLGLSIVKHGAKFHNASITVESKLNVGTTIRILF